MRSLLTLALCGLLAGPVLAQRGGGGHGGGGGGGFHGGGGFGGGGFRGGGGFGGGGFRGGGFGGGGFRGGGFGGFRGGFGGFRGGFRGAGFGRGGWGGKNWGWGWGGAPLWGWGGWGAWPAYWGDPYWDYGYPYAYDGDYGYGGAAPAYYTSPGYSSPGVNIVYAPQTAPTYVERANPVVREYDQYGQEVNPQGPRQSPGADSSPVYLIALANDQAIRAAVAYWVTGQTLHYVTLQHEERVVPLSSVDRQLTLQLNRERHVAIQLP